MNDLTQTVSVPLGPRSYEIAIGTGNLGTIADALGERFRRAVMITDRNVQPHSATVTAALAAAGLATDELVIDPGEAQKSMAVASRLLEELLACGADRHTLVVAVGGGVVGDLAGFVAATYARGVPFFQVPTTLLAQVDSSVGGKVGVNLPGAKNMAGAFWQPVGVLIDTAVLDTLPDREYRAGLAEVVKYGVILDAEFFAWLEAHIEALNQRQPEALRHIIARSCQLKADVVSQDERETTGLRAVLNYGHTFCHAFEALTGYGQYLHGEAVAIGMICASRLAERLGRIDADATRRQADLLAALGLSLDVPPLDTDDMLASMARDKKSQHGRLRFILPTRIGHVELVGDVPADDVRAVLV